MPYGLHDPHSKRIFDANDWRSYDITENHIRSARRAYFANVSYLDDKIGEVLDTLRTFSKGTKAEVKDWGVALHYIY